MAKTDGLVVKISVLDTELFKDINSIVNEMMNDKRIPVAVQIEYQEKMIHCIDSHRGSKGVEE